MLEPTRKTLDGLDALIAAEYKEIEVDGEKLFSLDVSQVGGWELANTTGLKTALERERAAVKELKRQAGSNRSAEDVAELETQIESLKREVAKKGNNETEAVKAAREELKQFHEAEMAKISGEKTELEQSLHGVMVKQVAQEALASGGFKTAGKLMLGEVMKHLRVGRDAESGELTTEVIDIKSADKHRRIGGSDAEWMTVKQLVSEFKNDPEYASFADGTGHSGADIKGGGSERVQTQSSPKSTPLETLTKVWGG